MDINQAIDHLEYINWRYCTGKFDQAMSMAIGALRAQQNAEKNDPLTLDELREMDGKPVFVTFFDGSGGHWAVVRVDFLGLHADDGNMSCWFESPQNCVAYRRPPKED